MLTKITRQLALGLLVGPLAFSLGCERGVERPATDAGTEAEAEGTADSGGGLSDLFSRRKEVDLTVPSGTVLAVRLGETVSSNGSTPGQRFQASVVEPVYVSGHVAIPSGSTVTGTVVEAVPSKKIGGRSSLGLDFDTLALRSGDEVAIDASFQGRGKSQVKKDAATIGGATAGGAVLGRIIGHQRDDDSKGTAIGAVVGAAVGTGVALSNRGQPVTLTEGTVLQIQLDSPVTVTVEG